ncbi:MAG TPA: hypothetical protein VMH20_14380 [Verrucomicrobiae bacterium]|nr:hypothetical protein [Verrucomicrobiae bacterium]
MRFVRALQFLFLLSLAVALFGGEVVESACFVNDVSNDYIQAPASPAHQLAKKAQTPLRQIGAIGLGELASNFAVISSIKPAPSSASDLLRLLSIQRK